MLQVIAGVVLAQPAQAIPDAPVRQHHFQTQYQIAHRAPAQGMNASCIGRNIPSYGAAAFRTKGHG